MTNPQVDAGRELDKLIATEVMGYRVEKREGEYVLPHLRTVAVSVGPGGLGEPEQVAPTLPRYSTDICEAWEVVDRLALPDKVSFGVLRLFDGGWKAYTYSEDRGLDIEAEAETAPLAICRAALAAVRADTEGADAE